jgi:hypothetical protein
MTPASEPRNLVGMLKRIGVKRLAFLALAPAFIAVTIDAGISHAVGKEVEHAPQYVPIFFGPLAALATAALGAFALSERVVRRVSAAIGLLGAVIGTAGLWFHFQVLVADLSDETFSLSALAGALSLSPPVLAPGAFAGLGVLVLVLGHPKFRLDWGGVGDKKA